jgi:hypothetical protein
METNELAGAIIAAAIEVHKRLGPGLWESAYRVCLAYKHRGTEDTEFGSLISSVLSVPLCFKPLFRLKGES